MIPALIVPTLNQPGPLDAMLRSIDRQVDQIIVIDNGAVTVDWDMGHDIFLDRVIRTGHNIGVAASWNLGIKVTPHADWWLIVNDDITFGAGDLERLEQTVDPASPVLYYLLGMAAFAVTPSLIDEVGWFDEGFINAYNEDVDFSRRCDAIGIERVEVGFTGTHIGSATIYADPELRAWNHQSHMMNDRYYAAKWGGPKQGGETYDVPFDGMFHRTEPRLSRLRAQIWPRED